MGITSPPEYPIPLRSVLHIVLHSRYPATKPTTLCRIRRFNGTQHNELWMDARDEGRTMISMVQWTGRSGPATSHRAECWGKLSVARFLHHLPRFSSMTYPQHLKIISMADNQGLVTTLAKRNEYTTPYPNSTLQSDWDLIEEIYTTYQHLNIANSVG